MKELPEITFGTVTVERSEVSFDPWFYENYREIGIPAFQEKLIEMDKTLRTGLNLVRTTSSEKRPWVDDAVHVLEAYATSTATLRRYIGLAKTPKVLEIITEELKENQYEKIVIFAVHQSVIEMTRSHLKDFNPVTLYGGTPPKKRQANIDRFQNDKYCRVFVGQIQAAGDSITLTAAHEVAFLEADWVPFNNAQAAARCHRIGQTEKVRARFFVCAETVDEDVMRAVATKTREIAKFLD